MAIPTGLSWEFPWEFHEPPLITHQSDNLTPRATHGRHIGDLWAMHGSNMNTWHISGGDTYVTHVDGP